MGSISLLSLSRGLKLIALAFWQSSSLNELISAVIGFEESLIRKAMMRCSRKDLFLELVTARILFSMSLSSNLG